MEGKSAKLEFRKRSTRRRVIGLEIMMMVEERECFFFFFALEEIRVEIVYREK